jgi:hypothetical protein
MLNVTKFNGPNGLVVELNPAELYEGGTPAMVYRNKNLCDEDNGTFACACGEGELSYRGTKLSQREMSWLESLEPRVEAFLSKGAR